MKNTKTPKYAVGHPERMRGWRYCMTKRDADKLVAQRIKNGKHAEIMVISDK